MLGMRQILCVLALVTSAAACGSTQGSSALETVPPSRRATSGVEDRAQIEARDTQLMAFVRAVRAKLGDDFVGTSGATDGKSVATDIDVILLDGESARSRVPEIRALFVATVPAISPDVLHFVFAPVSEKVLLAAYETFGSALSDGDLELASFISMEVDRASGSLLVVLDGTKAEAALDAEEIEVWAKSLAPVSVRLTIDQTPGKFQLEPSASRPST
jgi:hypothetical protein